MELITKIVAAVNDVLWNKQLLLLFLLLGTGIFYSIRTRFVQVRKFGQGCRQLFGSISLSGDKAGKDGMSSFQALATAIAAQVGTGNISGCATALLLRRPRGHLLDVAQRLFRHVHHLRRGRPGPDLPHHG